MTKDKIFKSCLNKKENFRNSKILESKEKLSSLYDLPNVLNLVNELGSLKLEKVKLELANKSINHIETKIKETKINLLKVFKEHGIDIKDLTPNFSCKKCEDKGIVNDKICECLNEEYLNELLMFCEVDLKNIPVLNQINTNIYSNQDEIIKLINVLQNLIKNPKFNTILFSGETGTGKTYISKSFLRTYILNNKLGLFIPSFNLNNELVNYHFNYDKNKSLERYLEPDLLVVEDLGTESIHSLVTNEYFLLLLNERQENNKLTLFTTNLTLNDIKIRYNERFFSRLVDKNMSLKYNFKGKDIRIK